tara:strand:+ start:7735 stop:8106 length:372 start_codon:yes stop_codon:yes gene_type:complete
MKKIIFILLLFFSVSSFSFIKKYQEDKEELRFFCKQKTYLGMRIYDNIITGVPLENIVVYWKYPPVSYEEAVFREHWLHFLKTEVNRLVLQGRLSTRVQQTLYKLCLERDQYYDNKKIYATNT